MGNALKKGKPVEGGIDNEKTEVIGIDLDNVADNKPVPESEIANLTQTPKEENYNTSENKIVREPIYNDIEDTENNNIDVVDTGYDVVLDIQKISDVTTGWPILVGEKVAIALSTCGSEEEAFATLRLDQQSTVVGVFGLFNRGKTHLLNHLGRISLPSGKKVHTRGLSFIKPFLNINAIFLDTAGTNSPVDRSYFDTLTMANRDPLSEKKTTEILIQELAFALSDVVILVVSELTWPDQEFIETMQRKLRDSEKHHKTLIVVHNFYDIGNEDDLLDMWRSCVVSTVKGIVQSEALYDDFPAIYFKQQMDCSSEMPTIHVFLAKEGSEAGKLWNSITYNYLRGRISKADIPKKDTLHNLLITKAKEVLKLYTRNPENVTLTWEKVVPVQKEKIYEKPVKSHFGGKTERIVKDEWMRELITTPEPPPGHFLLKCTGDMTLTHSVDFDGFRILFTRKTEVFQPKFDVLQTEKGLLVMMDIPGVDWKKDIKIRVSRKEPDYPDKIVLVISGVRRLYYRDTKEQEKVFDQYEKAICPKLKRHAGTDRLSGSFVVFVVIPTEIDDNPRNAERDYENGILRVFLPKKDDDGDLLCDDE